MNLKFPLLQNAQILVIGDLMLVRYRYDPTSRASPVYVVAALGTEIGRLHSKKIIHGDLRPNNVLIELGADKPIFHFIDNERTL